MRKLLALLPCLVAACADRGAEVDRRMGEYVGRRESELVSSLGVPARVQDVGAQRFLDYDLPTSSGGPTLIPSLGLGFGVGRGVGLGTGVGAAFGGGSPAVCAVTFELRQGLVQSFTRRGEGCA